MLALGESVRVFALHSHAGAEGGAKAINGRPTKLKSRRRSSSNRRRRRSKCIVAVWPPVLCLLSAISF